MRKKLIAAAVVALCLSLMAYSTIAYFTHEDTARNVITSGNISIDIEEKAENNEPFRDVFGVMPGQSFAKVVTVHNNGDNAAYVRISVSKVINLASGVPGTPDTDLIWLDINTEKWTFQDGYWYYNIALEPGEETVPLFNQVKFNPEMGNEYQNSEAVITVLAQATQVKNNGTNVFDAAGWPAAE
ncbi:MAG: TasA family protein [Firmicutes bacterium]|nr:TasA family protein [Bacillota bacterium]